MEEIDLKELLTFVKTKIGLLITITVGICLIGCIYGLFIQVPMYQSDTTIILSSNDSEITNNDIAINQNLVDTYAEIVKSRRVLNQVIEELNLDITYKELYEKIKVSAVNDTEIIRITVEDKDAIKAKNIAPESARSNCAPSRGNIYIFGEISACFFVFDHIF